VWRSENVPKLRPALTHLAKLEELHAIFDE
jgi:hypothetical protein